MFCEVPQRSRNGIFLGVHHFSVSINTEQTEHLCRWVLRLVRKHEDFFVPPYEGNFDIGINILIYTFLFFATPLPPSYFQTIGRAFENYLELFDHLLGYRIIFQNNGTRPVMNLWEACSVPQKSSPLLHKSKRSKILFMRAFQTVFNNYHDRWIPVK